MQQSNLFRAISFLLLQFICAVGIAQSYIPGNSYSGRNKYIEYIAGNLPLIISVPHGGSLSPPEIPDRTCGDETVTDLYTVSLAGEIKNAILKLTGCYPHMIICNLKRTKLDVNRDINEAACGNEFAGTAWSEFHGFIDSASANVLRKSGKGLYIDLHGHGHTVQRLELGYLLTATQLRYSNAALNASTFIYNSSIRNLINSNVTNQTHSDLIRGPYSLGSMISARGYPAVPSSDDPNPLTGQSYFNGGYNTEKHGSNTSGTIDGIQIECNQDVRFNEQVRQDFASSVAVVLLDFLIRHYFPDMAQTYFAPVGLESAFLSGIHAYPNPFGNTLYIQKNMPSDLKIYDFSGKLVFSKKSALNEKINLENLENGIYFISLSNEGKILFRKMMIKRSGNLNGK